MHRKLSLVVSLLVTVSLGAQLPNTELWLFKIESTKTGRSLKDGLNITKREGYDNQPSFSADGQRIYYISIREDKQADIYYYEVKKKKTVQLTKSSISEYSPAETPDGKLLSAVVVESDSAQCVHFINPLSGIHEKKIELDSVGYYSFLNMDTLVYYKLTEPHSLRYFVPNTHEDKWLGNLPTRGIKTLNRHQVVYGLKDSTHTVFYTYSFLLRKAERYADYPSLSEDIIWHKDFGLVKSEGSKLLRFEEKEKEWVLLFDLSAFNLKKITRFHIDPKSKYLVVAENL